VSDEPVSDEAGPDLSGDGHGDVTGDRRPAGELGYAAASAELEAIIAELDQGLVDVDHLEVRFRRAIEIVEELDRRIHRARAQVDALLPRLGAVAGGTAGAGANRTAQASTPESPAPASGGMCAAGERRAAGSPTPRRSGAHEPQR
jgi:exonuclease VII small subunit